MTFTPEVIQMIVRGIGETLFMVFTSSFISYLIGIPLGVFLITTDKNGIRPMPVLNSIVGVVINFLRSVPFMILLIMVLPVTRAIVGTTLGAKAVIPPLVFSAAPYVARMVESSLKEVDPGVIEAARSMGASNWYIIIHVLLLEARTSLIVGATICCGTILGYTAMAGTVGGGGLGNIAINYGYYRWDTTIMIVTVILIIILFQIIQTVGMFVAKKLDRRK